MNTAGRATAFTVLFLLACATVVGQEAAQKPSPTATTTADNSLDTPAPQATIEGETQSAEAEPAKAKTVDEAVAEATAILDRLDANFGEPPAREDTDALSGLLPIIQRAGRSDPRADYLTGRILALFGKSRASTAISALQRYVETREGRNDWKAHRVLGDLLVDDYQRMALSSYQKAAELKPDEPSVLMGLSLGYYGVGDRQRALDYAKELVRADGGVHISPIAHLARMYAANQQWDEASRMATAALQKAQQQLQADPTRRTALVLLAEQYDLLIVIVQSSIGAGSAPSGSPPKGSPPAAQATPHQYATIARYTRERSATSHKIALHDVLSLLKRALDTTKPEDSAPLLEEYGTTLAELGRTAEAIETFEKLLTLDPANATAREWVTRLRPNRAGPSKGAREP